jgi:putative cell wall-binding protein
VAYVATGTNFPDALSAAAAAAKQHGPLLLSAPNSLPSATATALSNLRPTTVVLVGGTSALSAGLQAQITAAAKAWGGTVEREAGANRYSTGQLIVTKAFATATRVFIATGANYPDALSASAAAGSAGVPVVLVNGTASGLDTATLATLRRLGATEFDVVGGAAAVSAGIASDLATLGTVHRFAGSDRYTTSAAINASAFPAPARAYYVTGTQFPDALSGAVLAAVRGAPLYVVQPTCVPSATADVLADAGTGSVTLIGGPNALAPSLQTQATCG